LPTNCEREILGLDDPAASLRDRSRLSRNAVLTGFNVAVAHFVANRCHTPYGGAVLADEGSVWVPDRNVKVQLRGPEVYAEGYRDGERYHVTLTGDRLVVGVGRSQVERVHVALDRERRRRGGVD
jgi:hypothetical protein